MKKKIKIKKDQDCLCVNLATSVPVIFVPPFTRQYKIKTNLFERNAMSRNSREYFASLVNVSVGSSRFVLFWPGSVVLATILRHASKFPLQT